MDYPKEINRKVLHNWIETGAVTICGVGSENIYVKGEFDNEFFHKGDNPDWYVKQYLDYVNNFLTVAAFGRHYDIIPTECMAILTIGKQINEIYGELEDY